MIALTPRGNEEGSSEPNELSDPRLPRKSPVELTAVVSVPQTNSGGREEYSKALERTHPKELGKILP